jgi:hypothetical protein
MIRHGVTCLLRDLLHAIAGSTQQQNSAVCQWPAFDRIARGIGAVVRGGDC